MIKSVVGRCAWDSIPSHRMEPSNESSSPLALSQIVPYLINASVGYAIFLNLVPVSLAN